MLGQEFHAKDIAAISNGETDPCSPQDVDGSGQAMTASSYSSQQRRQPR